MPRLSAPRLSLSESDRQALEQLINRPSTPQQIALRAKIILRADRGESHGEIARGLSIGKAMSRHWRKRWLELSEQEVPVFDRLQDAHRSGAPPTFTLEQITKLYALACVPPEQCGRLISHWTPQALANELIQQQIVPTISARHVSRLLAEADLEPYQSRP